MITLITASRTGPNKSVTFGSAGLSLDERGRTRCVRLRSSVPQCSRVWCGPDRSAVETAHLLYDTMIVESDRTSIDMGSIDVGSIDMGQWARLRPDEVDPDALREWFTDLTCRPHGGESVADFVARVGAAFSEFEDTLPGSTLAGSTPPGSNLTGSTVVVAMPVAQALLTFRSGEVDSFWSHRVAPAQVIELGTNMAENGTTRRAP